MTTTAHTEPLCAHQFDDLEQQRETATLGMWCFLASEVLFFGGLVAAYAVYRFNYPASWVAGSHHLRESLGGINTAVLLTSSFTVALAVHFNRLQRRGMVRLFLALTLVLGAAFLAIKFTEYSIEYRDHLVPAVNFNAPDAPPHMQLFMLFYFFMTLLHATHMLVGLGLLTYLVFRPRPAKPNFQVEIIALYWHFVDLVWIFLFPLLYLVR